MKLVKKYGAVISDIYMDMKNGFHNLKKGVFDKCP